MKVPFLNLKGQYTSMKDEIDSGIQQVIDETAFAGGPFVETFENAFARYCDASHAVALNSGTTALWAALRGLGVGPGDEVITVPNTFVATVEAIVFAGATPILVDVASDTLTMDPVGIEHAITPRTKAIIPVHLYGQMADMDPIMEVARAHHLFVIEDAAQAHGARYKSRLAGSIGDAGCFSFYPGKNLGAFGEGGAVVTENEELADYMRKLRDHGQTTKYFHSILGWNARMDGIQGAVLSAKLTHLEDWNAARRRNAVMYDALLAEIEGIQTPVCADYSDHIYHLYVIQCADRVALMKHLAQRGITCGIHYPVPVHLQEAFAGLGKRGDYVNAECASDHVLSLPMFPELTRAEIEYVVESISEFMIAQSSLRQAEHA